MKQKRKILIPELLFIVTTLIALLSSVAALSLYNKGIKPLVKLALKYFPGLLTLGIALPDNYSLNGIAINFHSWTFVVAEIVFVTTIIVLIGLSVIAIVRKNFKAFIPIGIMFFLVNVIGLGCGMFFPALENGVNLSKRFYAPFIGTSFLYMLAYVVGCVALFARFKDDALKVVLPKEMAEKMPKPVEEKKLNKDEKKKLFSAKINDFRNQTIIMAIGGVLAVITGAFFLLSFYLDRMFMGASTHEQAKALVEDKQALGFVIFAFAVATVILGGFVVYNAFPYIMKKDKLTVKKWYGYLNIALAVLSITLFVFCIVILLHKGQRSDVIFDGTNYKSIIVTYRAAKRRWLPIMAFALVSFVYNIVAFIPTLSVKTYMPEFFKENK